MFNSRVRLSFLPSDVAHPNPPEPGIENRECYVSGSVTSKALEHGRMTRQKNLETQQGWDGADV